MANEHEELGFFRVFNNKRTLLNHDGAFVTRNDTEDTITNAERKQCQAQHCSNVSPLSIREQIERKHSSQLQTPTHTHSHAHTFKYYINTHTHREHALSFRKANRPCCGCTTAIVNYAYSTRYGTVCELYCAKHDSITENNRQRLYVVCTFVSDERQPKTEDGKWKSRQTE